MFDAKYVPFVFPFYDRSGIQKRLEKQAASGWFLESAGSYFWKFRKGEPKALHYSVIYQPKLEPDDPASNVRQQQFSEYCAQAGWSLVADIARMQIYCSDADDPTPIETDALMELENIHRAAKKSYLHGCVLSIISVFLLIVNVGLRMGSTPMYALTSDSVMIYGLCLILMLLLSAARLVGYLLWYRKANNAAQTGASLPVVRTYLQRFLLAALILCFAAFLLSLGWQVALVFIVIGAVIILGTALIIRNTKRMREREYPTFENRTYTVILSVLLIVAVILMSAVLLNLADSNPTAECAAPMHIQELIVDSTDCECTAEVEESIFVRRVRVDCAAGNEKIIYQVADVKLPFVYGTVLNYYLQMYHDPIYTKLLGEDFDPNFYETDAIVWNAQQAYTLIWEPDNWYQYILCYDERIVFISYHEMLTQDQMGVIGEKLGK